MIFDISAVVDSDSRLCCGRITAEHRPLQRQASIHSTASSPGLLCFQVAETPKLETMHSLFVSAGSGAVPSVIARVIVSVRRRKNKSDTRGRRLIPQSRPRLSLWQGYLGGSLRGCAHQNRELSSLAAWERGREPATREVVGIRRLRRASCWPGMSVRACERSCKLTSLRVSRPHADLEMECVAALIVSSLTYATRQTLHRHDSSRKDEDEVAAIFGRMSTASALTQSFPLALRVCIHSV